MAKYVEKNGKQCSLLDIWQQKTSQLDTQTVQMATKCSQKQETDDALKRIFGYEAYKSDVQQKAVSAVLTGLFPLLFALWNRADHYIFIPVVCSIFLSFFFFPRIISAAADWLSAILPHMVWP